MAIVVKKILNRPINSNCFVVFDKFVNNNCFIVDPGGSDCRELEGYIAAEQLAPVFILLTHEHFDHCWGCNYLQSKYHIPVVGSKECIKRIRSHKSNYSVFYNPDLAFDVTGPSEAVLPGDDINVHGFKMTVISTPGHTDSSISILIDSHLFTGDALIKDLKTVTKLPGGSKEKNRNTMELYQNLRNKGIFVHSGHLDEFLLDDFDFIL